MLRRWLLLTPLLAAVSSAVGLALHDQPLAAVLLATAAGVATGAGLVLPTERRLREVAAWVQRLADGDTGQGGGVVGPGWKELGTALNALAAASTKQRADLAEEQARVQQLLEGLPTAVLLFTGERLTYANPAGQRLFGVGRDEALSPLRVLGVEALAGAVTEAAETGRGVSVEVERAERQLTASTTLIGARTVVMHVTDLTESRRLEAVRRDFVTNASHELKTPVAGMQALADSLGMAIDRDPVRARTMIWRLQSEAARLAQLVRDLLDLGRLEETIAASANRRRVDLAEVARSQAERLSGLASERGVTVRCECDRPAPLVALLPDLRLITANLLENAIRYNRAGGWVAVSVQRRRGEVTLEVADNGIGIPEADQDRVFERFYRVDKGRSRAAGGTGLGLAIVRHATERHGGEVSVRSVLGEGSTFRVVLPVEGSATAGRRSSNRTL